MTGNNKIRIATPANPIKDYITTDRNGDVIPITDLTREELMRELARAYDVLEDVEIALNDGDLDAITKMRTSVNKYFKIPVKEG